MPTKAKIPIPSVLSPAGTKCFYFDVPDDPEWIGMFWGALSNLTAWNSYQRSSVGEGKTVADVWLQVISDAHNGSCADLEPPHPNWYLDIDIDYANYDYDAWINPLVGRYGDGTAWAKYTLVVWGTGLGGDHFTVTGHDWDSGDPVGGNFDVVAVTNELDPAGQTYVLTTIDCLGNSVTDTNFTPRTYSGDFRSLEFTTGNISTYILKFTISGDWICSVA